MESRSLLKQRLARMFRASTLLRSNCSSSTSSSILSSSAAVTSSRTLSTDIAHEPVSISRHRLCSNGEESLLFHPFPPSVDNLRHRAMPLLSLDCGGCRPTKSSEADVLSVMTRNEKKKKNKKKKKKKERRVRETGGFYETGQGEGRTCPPASPSSPSMDYYYYYYFNTIDEEEKKNKKVGPGKKSKIRNKKKKKLLSNGYGFSSSSSMESDDGFEFFSSEEGDENQEETETFFSSRSFSSDSSEFYQRHSSNTKKKKKNKKEIKSFRRPPRRIGSEGFRPVISITSTEEEEEGKSGIPMMKRSSDPYVDFRNSMVEMIVERQIFGARDLDRLLHSYLSLNSLHHHPAILRAFADISEVLFGH